MLEKVLPWVFGVLMAAWSLFLGWAVVWIYGLAYSYLATFVDPMLLRAGQMALLITIVLAVVFSATAALVPRPNEYRSGIAE